ncbi:fumarylacetoacetate hydrolase family protein [Microtetraspora sp. AC03309]|uniref:fumarylacetoacetate hydrolase family protein n=1 Tax=Microtetraspora sp. AC03309 TaxID=2779376 RepID=UPI001E54A78D|nr:fumarylacetoacetate hydrolase family protein [Microtetraspora sp. AC03309]MCC5580296.1 fumarylacetoacetate hydrolase family protein [Microtetraspora sp. AC03309]
MKLVRYRPAAGEAAMPGLIDGAGRLRDLSGHIPDLAGEALGRAAVERLAALDVESLPPVPGQARLAPPVAGTRNFIAVGLNYRDHARETGMAVPAEPVLFSKAAGALAGPYDDVVIPEGATQVDWELELAVVIGERVHRADEAEAARAVAGYCICNDVSERHWQMGGTGQWLKGKSAPTFGPLGPWLVTPDEVGDVSALAMSLTLNGEVMQQSSTAEMIFPPVFLISYISRFMTLEPGDVVTTGTPAGVGMAHGRYLRPGDAMRLDIEGLGHQRQVVR